MSETLSDEHNQKGRSVKMKLHNFINASNNTLNKNGSLLASFPSIMWKY